VSIAPINKNLLRASDADRQRVADVLGQAYADGRLSMDEFNERNAAVWAAKTIGDLTPITLDLGGTPATVAVDGGAGLVNVNGVPAIRTYAILSTKRQPEYWAVPSMISVLSFMGSAEYDCRKATFLSPRVELSIFAYMGSVILYVPDGVSVIDKTTSVLGSIVLKDLTPAKPGAPVIELTGFIFVGSVEVRGAEYASLSEKLGFRR